MGRGSVSADMDDTKDKHRVHFDEMKDVVGKDNEITVHKKDGKLEVHLGFLQVNHRYNITFSIPRSLCQSNTDGQVVPADPPLVSPHLQIVSAAGNQDSIDFHLELFTLKEKLMIEEFPLRLSDVEEPITVALIARVLGKGKGTPLLKNEIHVIHGPVDEGESDASSDFHGFD